MPLIVPWIQRGAGRTAATAARGREPEVVVPVEVDGHAGADQLDACARRGRPPPPAWRSRACPRRRPPRARPRPRAEYACAKNSGSARVPSTPKYATVMPSPGGEARRRSRSARAWSRGVTPSASSLRSEIGDSITDARTPSSTSSLDVGRDRAREAPDLGAGARRPRISSTARPVVLGDAREAGLDPIDAERRRAPRAISSLSSGESTTPTVCSPSRSVVS